MRTLQLSKMWIYLALLGLFLINSAISQAEGLSNGQDIHQEALSVAQQYQSIVYTIQSQSPHITAIGAAHSIFNISIVEKVKAIIRAIQFQSQNLVNLVIDETTTNILETDKLNSILNEIKSERNALSTLIGGELDSTPHSILNPESKKEIVTTFQVYQQ